MANTNDYITKTEVKKVIKIILVELFFILIAVLYFLGRNKTASPYFISHPFAFGVISGVIYSIIFIALVGSPFFIWEETE